MLSISESLEVLASSSRIKRMWESLTLRAIKVYNKRIMKVMETVNVVIDESSDSSSEKGIEEFPKEILPPESKEVQEIVE